MKKARPLLPIALAIITLALFVSIAFTFYKILEKLA